MAEAPAVAPAAPPVEAPPIVAAPAVPAPAVAPAVSSLAAAPPVVEAPKAGEPPKVDTAAVFDPKAFKAPEGVKIDEVAVGAFAGVLNDSALSPQDRGAKLLELHNAELAKVGAANTKAWADTTTKWLGEIKADPKIGGDKITATVSTIAKAIDTLGPEGAKAFREALDITGAGNNPAVVRALHAFASRLTEGGHVNGTPPGSRPSTAALFFPNSPEMQKKGSA